MHSFPIENPQMKIKKSVTSESLLSDPDDFSFVLGGPLYQFFRRAHLSNDVLELLLRRIIFFSLFTWLPLLILSAIDGHLLDGSSTVPFLLDIDVHVRFLLVIPLLIAAELVVHRRLRHIVKVFRERNLIPESGMKKFDDAISSTFRLRDSMVAEVVLIILVYVVGVLIIWRQYTALKTATWYSATSIEGSKLPLAGIWYGYVSLPIFQFLLIRWYYRLFIWIRFLWKVSRIKLNLVPMHPDRRGGIDFLTTSAYAFVTLVIAHGAMLSGLIANRIFYTGASLVDFKLEIALAVVILLILILGPLLVFSPRLAETKRLGKSEFGTLAQRYVREFDTKWLRGGAPSGEQFIGTSDIQSLADIGNSHEVTANMRFILVTKESILWLVFWMLAPIAPLALTLMPLGELLKHLAGIIL